MTHIRKNRAVSSFLAAMAISIALGIAITGCTASNSEDTGEPKPMAADADLVQATATNGKEGYIKESEVSAASQPAPSPEVAAAKMRVLEAQQKEAFYVALGGDAAQADGTPSLSEEEASRLFDEIQNDADGLDEGIAKAAAASDAFSVAELHAAFTVALDAGREQTPIPVYDADGETVIGLFLVG